MGTIRATARLFAAHHEAGPVPCAIDAAAGPQVHQLDATLLEFAVAPDRVPPVGIAAVDNDVPRLEFFRQIIKHLVDDGAGRHVHENGTRRFQRRTKSGETFDLLEAGLAQLRGGAPELEARHNHFFPEGLQRQATAHAAQTDNPKLICDLYHVRSPFLFTCLPCFSDDRASAEWPARVPRPLRRLAAAGKPIHMPRVSPLPG